MCQKLYLHRTDAWCAMWALGLFPPVPVHQMPLFWRRFDPILCLFSTHRSLRLDPRPQLHPLARFLHPFPRPRHRQTLTSQGHTRMWRQLAAVLALLCAVGPVVGQLTCAGDSQVCVLGPESAELTRGPSLGGGR